MKDGLRIGLALEKRYLVEPKHLIAFMGQDVPGVLATPWLVAFMEETARHAITPVLDVDEHSVGTAIEVEHTAPTPAGMQVICRARVIRIDGRAITFDIRAGDAHEPIGRALHKRFVVSKSRFKARIDRKTGQPPQP